MRLLEYQAKRMLEKYGITVPKGMVITSHSDLQLVSFPTVLKAQIPIGRRGKAGAIRFADNQAEAQSMLEDLQQSAVEDHPIRILLAEDHIKAESEIYVACLIDKVHNTHMIMACAAGGVDIEEVAKTWPGKVIEVQINPLIGIEDFVVRSLTKMLRIKDDKAFSNILKGIYSIAIERDASLVEINPLAQTSSGWIALDAKVIVDDKAAFRHRDFFQIIETEQKELDQRPKTKSQVIAAELKLNYIPLKGDIGLIADGAGTGMLTMDLVYDAGGQPANFCEMGGLANTEIMERTLEAVLADKRIKVLLISLIGGLTRMDEMADGIVNYLHKNGTTVPIVVRMCGTKADIGIPLLQGAGIETYEDLMPAVTAAVNVARKQDNGHTH